MKKVRIMLSAMIVLGSVGGALALKAKKFGGSFYCTTNQGGVGAACPVLLQGATFVPGGTIWYRKVPTPNCGNTICTGIGFSAV